jgi:alkyl hydroperoxide reductase subunit AhpC
MSCGEVARVGKAAPNFEVAGFDAVKGSFETYSLSNFKGKYVVLFFYPADFTFVCPTELVSIASLKDEFTKANAQVFTISTDKEFTHKAWNEGELKSAVGADYPYPMLADTLGKVGAPYGIFSEESGLDLRGVVIIDKKGVVQSLSINNAPIGRNPKEVLRVLLAIKEHDDSGGKVIPACWVPGDEVIDAKIENSGKMWDNYKNVIQKGVVQGGNWRVN